MMIRPKQLKTPPILVKLWVHESARVFHDRLVNDEDRLWFTQALGTPLARAPTRSRDRNHVKGPQTYRPTVVGNPTGSIRPLLHPFFPVALSQFLWRFSCRCVLRRVGFPPPCPDLPHPFSLWPRLRPQAAIGLVKKRLPKGMQWTHEQLFEAPTPLVFCDYLAVGMEGALTPYSLVESIGQLETRLATSLQVPTSWEGQGGTGPTERWGERGASASSRGARGARRGRG